MLTISICDVLYIQFACMSSQVPQLAVTVKPGAGFAVTMTPPNYVEPVVELWTLKFNLNPDFENYKGKAGVVVTMPRQELEDVIATSSSVIYVLPDVMENDEGIEVTASTSAQVYIQDLEDDELQIKASTSAMVVVTASSKNDDLDVDISEADTSAIVHIVGAHEVDIDDADTSASITLVGSNLESVEISDINTDASVFAEYNNDDDDTEMTIDNIDTGGGVTIMNCDDLDVDDASTGAIIITNDKRNCDQVSKFTGGSSPDLTCTVQSDLDAPSTPDFPTNAVIDVDLSRYTCGLTISSGSSVTIGGDGSITIRGNDDD